MTEVALIPEPNDLPLGREWLREATRWLEQCSRLALDAFAPDANGARHAAAPIGAWAGLYRVDRPTNAPAPIAHAWTGYPNGAAREWTARVAPFRLASDGFGHQADPLHLADRGEDRLAPRVDLPDDAWRLSHARLHREGVGLGEFARLVITPHPALARRPALHLVVQLDGAPDGWRPDDALCTTLAAAGAALRVCFRRRIAVPTAHRTALLARISDAQAKVIPFLLNGLSERAIADRICRSPHTVHDHVKAVYAAFQVASRHDLIALWNLDGISPVMLDRNASTAHATPEHQHDTGSQASIGMNDLEHAHENGTDAPPASLSVRVASARPIAR